MRPPPRFPYGDRALRFVLVAMLACWLAPLVLVAESPAAPLLKAHSHNDYLHARPLLDALDLGFCSAEADIFLVDGQLVVAHDRKQLRPERTLQALYLDPLRARVRANSGRVYPGGPEFSLLIDLKTDWAQTYPVLRSVLTNYLDILTTASVGERDIVAGGKSMTVSTNAVLIVISGSRSREMFAGETLRVAAFDGELSDLGSAAAAGWIPWISCNWRSVFQWRGAGELPAEESARLKGIVTKAHEGGRRVRFWGAPDNVAFWQAMLDAGVDLINTDNLSGLERFLRDSTAEARKPAQ